MDRLSRIQTELVDEFINDSLTKSIEAMNSMLNIRVKRDYARFGLGNLREIAEFESLGRFKVYLIKVILHGDIKGALYFVINAYEVGIINKACLPDDVTGTLSQANKEMKTGFIVEIQNIIAANSATEISDFLGVSVLGGVPTATVLKGGDINDYLQKEAKSYNSEFYMESVLKGTDLDISPYLIWILDETFIHKLKENVVEPD